MIKKFFSANYKKPLFWIIPAAVLVCAAAAVIAVTNPFEKAEGEPKKDMQSQEVTVKEDGASKDDTVVSKDTETDNKVTTSNPVVSEEPVISESTESRPTTQLVIDDEIKAKIEAWRNSPSQDENKKYSEHNIDGNFEPGVIVVRFTEKAIKENFYKDYTVADFPELDIEEIVSNFQSTREAVFNGVREPNSIDYRSIQIVLKDKTKQAVIDGIKQIENREDVYEALPSQIIYGF